jgi:hypothetical protein
MIDRRNCLQPTRTRTNSTGRCGRQQPIPTCRYHSISTS